MMMTSPSGRLIVKAHRQLYEVASQPPSSGPTAAIPPIIDPQMPNATARSRPVKTVFTVDSVAGMIIEAPTPCAKRAAISSAPFPARAASRLASMNTTVPRTKSRRRP